MLSSPITKYCLCSKQIKWFQNNSLKLCKVSCLSLMTLETVQSSFFFCFLPFCIVQNCSFLFNFNFLTSNFNWEFTSASTLLNSEVRGNTFWNSGYPENTSEMTEKYIIGKYTYRWATLSNAEQKWPNNSNSFLLVALLKSKSQYAGSRLLWQQKLLWRNGAFFVLFP